MRNGADAGQQVRRWFLSYNAQDVALMQSLEAALRRRDAGAHIFFAPKSLRAGGYWLPTLADEIGQATVFVLLVGKAGLGRWQVDEYYEARDKRVRVVLVLLEGQSAPGLPFLRTLHWIVTADPASEACVARLMEAAAGDGVAPGELWRYAAPYRGLYAMTEADSDFFFGRTNETVEAIRALETTPGKLPVLLGNSGVGKSSLARAGIIAALARQAWPERAGDAGSWPQTFHHARQWCFLILRPGAEPVTALVDAFLDTWQFGAGDPARIKCRNEWVELLLDEKGKTSLADLLNETERRYRELDRPPPAAFFLYVDQGEELYARSEERQSRRFSKILARSLSDRRLRALMSLRADFSGALQKDESLFEVYHRIEVPPLREAQLREIVSRPAELLAARFESEHLADDIARRTAEESVKDTGALPLLSYLLDDMWSQMVRRGDGTLRPPAAAIALGGVLAERANAFLSEHPQSEEALRRLVLKLATVREDGEPMRRRAMRSEFNDEEWRLVSELADHPNRLLVTATPEGGEPYAEVAHEAIFQRWSKLRDWIATEREFLAWRSGLEAARRAWQATPEPSQNEALLMGVALAKAVNWLAKRRDDVPEVDREFVSLSQKAAHWRKLRVQAVVGALALAIVVGGVGWLNQDYLRHQYHMWWTARPYVHANVLPYVLAAKRERALKPGEVFKECAKDCPEMVVVPSGEFLMGSPASEAGHNANEGQTPHRVTIRQPFAISRFEVTFDEWDACFRYGDCRWVNDDNFGRGRKPVIHVTWADAQQYVGWLTRVTGKRYRLPTEAEWEYAARAGEKTIYSWGDDIGKGNAICKGCGNKPEKGTASVGTFAPNKFGLYDMLGNVWEWVEDCYHSDYVGAPADGTAWTSSDCEYRIVRGGSWVNSPSYLRAAYRVPFDPAIENNGLGFRIVRDLSSDQSAALPAKH